MRHGLSFSAILLLLITQLTLISLSMTTRDLKIDLEAGRGGVSQPVTTAAVLERPASQAAITKSMNRICIGLTDDGMAY